MCDQTQVSYLPGDIVWVKLSSLWWPAEVQDPSKLDDEVTGGLKKKPLAVVKFFNEEAYEYPKNLDQIYHYNCLKKDEFIRKGLDLLRAATSKTPSRSVPSSIDKFPNDVCTAEEKTNGDPEYINNPKFAHSESNLDETMEETSTDIKQIRKRSSILPNTSKSNVTPPKTKFSKKKITPKTILKTSVNGSKTPSSLLKKNKHTKLNVFNLLDPKYNCIICESFTTRHSNVLLKHMTYHYMGRLPGRPPVIPRRYLTIFNETEKSRSQKPSEEEELKSPEKRKRKKSEEPTSKKSVTGKQSDSLAPPKKRNKKAKTPPPEEVNLKQEVALEILKDWSDSEDESDIKKDSDIKADTNSPAKTLNSHPPKRISTSPVKTEKSCFDFEDNEDSLNVDGALKFGKKLPRVLNEKHSSNRLRTSSKTDDNQDELSKQVDIFLETVNVPNVPEITETITSLKDDTDPEKKGGTVESETDKKKASNSVNKSPKSTSLEECDSLKKKKSDTSSPALESGSSSAHLKNKLPLKRSLSSAEKDSKLVSEDTKDHKLRRKSQRSSESEGVKSSAEDESSLSEKNEETRVLGTHTTEKESIKDNKTATINEDSNKDIIKKEYFNKEPLKSPLVDEKINNSSVHFLSINEVKMKPPEKTRKSSRSDHKKEDSSSDKKSVPKNVKDSISEDVKREKHDRKVKTTDTGVDIQNMKIDNQKTSKSDKHSVPAKSPKHSSPEKGRKHQVEHSAKHGSISSMNDTKDKSKLETDRHSKRVEHASKHERGAKHRSSDRLSTVKVDSSSAEKSEKSSKRDSIKSAEEETGKTSQQSSEKHPIMGLDKSSRKRTEKASEKDYHSSQKKHDKIKHIEKDIEKEKKLDAKDKCNKRKLENEKSRIDSKKQKKHKIENVESVSNQESNKSLKKIKKPLGKDPQKIDHKTDKKAAPTDCVKESINSFAIDSEKKTSSHRKVDDIEVDGASQKLYPLEKKSLGDLALEKTFIKTSSSTFLSEPDIQSECDQHLEDSVVVSCETSSERLEDHLSSIPMTKQDTASKIHTVSELHLTEPTSTNQEKMTMNSGLISSSINKTELSNKIEQPILLEVVEHSETSGTKEQICSQNLDSSHDKGSKENLNLDSPDSSSDKKEIMRNQEKEVVIPSSESEHYPDVTSKEKILQSEQAEINSSRLDKSNNISEDTDQYSNAPSSLYNNTTMKISNLATEKNLSMKDATAELDPCSQNNEIKGAENKATIPLEQSDNTGERLLPSESLNPEPLHKESDRSKSTIEEPSKRLNEVTIASNSSPEFTTLQVEDKSDTPTKGVSDIDGSLAAEDLDIKSMPIEIETGKDVGPIMEIMVGLQPFETIPGARVFEVHLRRVGEPFPKDIEHLIKYILKFSSRKNESNNTIYGLKKMPFPKYNPENAYKGEIDKVEQNANYMNDYNNNPKKIIIPLGTLNLQDDKLSPGDKVQPDSKSTNSLRVLDKPFPTQVLVTMPKNVQTDHFKVPSQQLISSQCSKFSTKSTGNVIVCNSIRQIKPLNPGSVVLPQSNLGTTPKKSIKQFSIPKRSALIQSKATNILLNGSSLQGFQVIPLTAGNKQTEKEKIISSKLQHSITTKNVSNILQKMPNILQRSPKKPVRQSIPGKSGTTQAPTMETSVSPQTVVQTLPTSGTDQVLLLDLGSCALPVQTSSIKTTKVIRVQNPKNIIKTTSQDILAEAIANTKVLQSDLESSEFVGTSLTNNVLETSLTLNQPPIMTPLEVPSTVSPGPVPILAASDQPTIYLTTPYVINSATPIVIAQDSSASSIESEQNVILSGVVEEQRVGESEDKDNVLPEFLKGDFSKRSPKKNDSSNNR